MYWPTAISRALDAPSPLNDEPVLRLRQSRKGNFFISLSKSSLGVWDVRPCVLQAALIRSPESLERWGSNVDACWAHDGRGILILTSTSHLLVYQLTPTSKPSYDHPSTSQFPLGGGAGEGDILMGWTLCNLGVAFIMGGCESLPMHPQSHSITFTLRHPPSVLTTPYPIPSRLLSPPGSHHPPAPLDGDGEEQAECEVWDMEQGRTWMGGQRGGKEGEMSIPKSLTVVRTPGSGTMHVLHTEDGRVWGMQSVRKQSVLVQSPSDALSTPVDGESKVARRTSVVSANGASGKYTGQLLYPILKPDIVARGLDALGLSDISNQAAPPTESGKAVITSINPKFGLMAIGLASGCVDVINLPTLLHAVPSRLSHSLDLCKSASLRTSPGSVTTMAWTSDGYALAVGYEHGWAVWTVGGRLNGWGMALAERDGEGGNGSTDGFNEGVVDLFWAPGNLELFLLANPPRQLYVLPFVKSATTGQNSPDNTRHAFLQMDDRVLIYRGADKSDVGVINPQSDAWQHVKVPSVYMSTNWPLRYASISTDGQLVAVAGRRGLTHYSAQSGKWKLFGDERQEQDFTVRGGLLWFHHVLIVATEVNKTYQIRLYSRDQELADSNILHSHILPSPVLVMSLLDNSLLVFTADNTLYHFLIIPTKESIRMHQCGSISFEGIVQVPSRVRALSWLIPEAQKRLGDPADDLIVATIIFLVDGKLVLLRPRRAGSEEVRYDMQVLADRIESYWTHLHGVGTLENSLWGYDGEKMRVWLDALTVEHTRVEEGSDAYENIGESIGVTLDFYPLSILMDKGVIIGVDYENSYRATPFDLHKLQTSTHLFLPQFMRYHLASTSLRHALVFASNYSSIVYFAHSLEMLLHSTLEDACAEKRPDASEIRSEIGNGRRNGNGNGNGNGDGISADTDRGEGVGAGSSGRRVGTRDNRHDELSQVMEFLDHFPESLDVVVGCARKTEVDRWKVLFEAAGDPRVLYEACVGRGSLRTAAGFLLVLHTLEELGDVEDTVRLIRLAMEAKEVRLGKELLRFLHSVDDSGESLRKAVAELGLNPTFDVPMPSNGSNGENGGNSSTTSTLPLPSIIQPHPRPTLVVTDSTNPKTTSSTSVSTIPSRSDSLLGPTPSSSSSSSTIPQIKRITSPFQLESPRLIFSPPSPRTVEPSATGRIPDALDVPDVD